MISVLLICSTGTVPLGEIVYSESGRFFNDISRNSIFISDLDSAILARIAHGHLRNVYRIGYLLLDMLKVKTNTEIPSS